MRCMLFIILLLAVAVGGCDRIRLIPMTTGEAIRALDVARSSDDVDRAVLAELQR